MQPPVFYEDFPPVVGTWLQGFAPIQPQECKSLALMLVIRPVAQSVVQFSPKTVLVRALCRPAKLFHMKNSTWLCALKAHYCQKYYCMLIQSFAERNSVFFFCNSAENKDEPPMHHVPNFSTDFRHD